MSSSISNRERLPTPSINDDCRKYHSTAIPSRDSTVVLRVRMGLAIAHKNAGDRLYVRGLNLVKPPKSMTKPSINSNPSYKKQLAGT